MSPKSYIVPVAIVALGAGWMWTHRAERHESVVISVRVPVTVDEWCQEHSRSRRGWSCEVREFSLPAGALHGLNASPNGGILVEGWDRDEILVSARIVAQARTDAAARELVSEVNIVPSGPMLGARGPRSGRGKSWSVSYRAKVPRQSDLSLRATNGDISIAGVMGNLQLRTTNGGIQLTGVGGNVRGGTTNGGLEIELAGDAWAGEGLEMSTINGTIEIAIPAGYNALLESATTHGRIEVGFPITVTGRINRRLRTELGSGGATIKAVTINGAVLIRRK